MKNVTDELIRALDRKAKLERRTKKLEKMSSFMSLYEYDDEIHPQKATYKAHNGYCFVSSPIREVRAVLRTYKILVVIIDKISYFLFKREDKKMQLFELMECSITNKITISFDNVLGFSFSNPDVWNTTAKQLAKEFSKIDIESTLYRPSTTPTAPMLIPTDKDGNKTAKAFTGIDSIHRFYFVTLCYHLIFRCGLHKQKKIKKVKISNSDLKKLLPASKFPLKKLETFEFRFLKSATKCKGYYLFEFKEFEKIKNFQFIKIPYALLLKAFSPKVFNYNLKYFLLIMYGYHVYPFLQCCYKLSTIIELAQLNRTRGKNYLISLINKPLLWLKENSIIKEFTPVTTEDLSNDKVLTIQLDPLNHWKPPKS